MKSGHFFGIMRNKSILIIVTEEMEQQPVREAADGRNMRRWHEYGA
jgi:hypothetical protein